MKERGGGVFGGRGGSGPARSLFRASRVVEGAKSYRDDTPAIGRPLINSRAAFLALTFGCSTGRGVGTEDETPLLALHGLLGVSV